MCQHCMANDYYGTTDDSVVANRSIEGTLILLFPKFYQIWYRIRAWCLAGINYCCIKMDLKGAAQLK